MNTEQITHAVKGIGSLGVIEVANQIPVDGIMEVFKLIIQAMVGIGTLYHMWKSRNKQD